MGENSKKQSPRLRTMLAGEEIEQEKRIRYMAHDTSIIEEGCKIGDGSKIWHFSHIGRHTVIGKDCVIGDYVYIGPEVEIGDRCKIQNHVSIFEGVTIEDDVFIGPGAMFTNVNNPRAFINRRHAFRHTNVAKGASVGANVTIICGHSLGRYSFIGAGSVVTADVLPFALVVGVPARQVCWISAEGAKQMNRPGV